MKKIICLTDYHNYFGSKWNSDPYRSGMDKEYLTRLFSDSGYVVEYISMAEVDFSDPKWKGQPVLYTSSEEHGYHYKSFIEDVVFGLDRAGAVLIPRADFLRANNNKVYMEILRQVALPDKFNTLNAQIFGTYEELDAVLSANQVTFPCVLKTASGAMSSGVFLAHDENELRRQVRKIGRTAPLKVILKEKARSYKHQGYKTESSYQGKFIIQPFVAGLKNDWKVISFGHKYYCFERPVRKNDFRASGSGSKNYIYGSETKVPEGLLDFARELKNIFSVPSLSIDIAYDGNKLHLVEFQAIHFGTVGQVKSKDFYEYCQGKWELRKNIYDIEHVYVDSIVEYLNR
ncbi:MAG: hypothetical protein K9L66_00280 [Spirochaetaceae bacterium]|nr:hypothetical protein [Spirochaetaceae bacterium]MCF7947182.1 hypothetical protein [Spirochaetia bacterium]MCF7950047.1 hypothetical protein [Spirochaetaceae bacterium]